MIEQLIVVLHVLTALAIIALILLQQGKGADMGASFGSGSSQTVFGAAGGGNLLTKGTALLATLFFATSLGLAVYARQHAESLDSVDLPVPAAVEVPAMVMDEEVPVVDSIESSGDDVPVAEEVVN